MIQKLSEDNDANLEYDQFENVIDILLALLNLFEELKEYYEESNERSEGVGPEV